MKISGETPFNVMAHSFSFYSPDSVTLNYSTDGEHFTAVSAATEAGKTEVVNGIAKNMVFKLVGNTNEATIIY